jgi:hypothetical protein
MAARPRKSTQQQGLVGWEDVDMDKIGEYAEPGDWDDESSVDDDDDLYCACLQHVSVS